MKLASCKTGSFTCANRKVSDQSVHSRNMSLRFPYIPLRAKADLNICTTRLAQGRFSCKRKSNKRRCLAFVMSPYRLTYVVAVSGIVSSRINMKDCCKIDMCREKKIFVHVRTGNILKLICA